MIVIDLENSKQNLNMTPPLSDMRKIISRPLEFAFGSKDSGISSTGQIDTIILWTMKLVAPLWYFELAFEADFTISIQAWTLPWLKKAKDTKGKKKTNHRRINAVQRLGSENCRDWSREWVSEFLGTAPGNEDRGVLEAKTSERLQQTYGGELNYLLNEKMEYPWSQLELDQILTLVTEYGKRFGAAVYVDEEMEHVIQALFFKRKVLL